METLKIRKSDTGVNRQFLPLLFIFVYSTILMLLVSKSSFIYYINDWVDINSFYTMGKGWLHGKIPYRDLFDHKGPLLYFIYAIADLLSPRTYLGILLFEIMAIFTTLLLVYRIAASYMKEYAAVWATLLFSGLLVASPYFDAGAGVEELSYPFIMFTIYAIHRLNQNDFTLTFGESFLSGICFGMIFWMKYTMLGGWLGFIVAYFVVSLIRKNAAAFFSFLGYFFLGFLAISLPVIGYFFSVGALSDLYHIYFYVNLAVYPPNFHSKIGQLGRGTYLFITAFKQEVVLNALMIFATIFVINDKAIFRHIETKMLYTASFLAMGMGTFFGGISYRYYVLALFPFGCIPVLCMCRHFFYQRKNDAYYNNIKTFLLACFTLIVALNLNTNFFESKFFAGNKTVSLRIPGEKTDHYKTAQYQFAKIINQEKKEKQTLLNYGFLDVGLYRAAAIVPDTKYFMKQNIAYDKYPVIMDTQNEIIDKKKVEFVVFRKRLRDDIVQAVPKNIRKNYMLIAKHSQFVTGEYTYLLYKVKPAEKERLSE
ncbi:ArnT family glycosyltransferase [Vagococcus acidifermentans]|uniref:Glycosyltransferase RgtA/B/C/D-like domain-containing protein n=1 Tax=Vagococcus acidifermentans TaxID=564710 RepID=A0A430AY34_9ENTE|nr:glycosyltransferase family 39 protein [Vagococcus acidifermentans]RSU12981.1 hypothetical protein CBF27_05450 [Vagococcus acidifermentans]